MLRITTLFLLSLLGAACVSGPRENVNPIPDVESVDAPRRPIEAAAPVQPVKPPAWTKAFEKGAILVGHTIRVEGPPGLMVHAALTVDDTLYVLEKRTTEQGFLQVVTAKPGAGREMRCQLDRWTLAAGHRIEVLERIVPCDVVVTAEGNATWRDLNNNVQREERLEFRGAPPKE
jgi:hypothetical protein